MAQNRNQPPNADRERRQQQNSNPGQQQQFDANGARQPGGGAPPDSRFADQIREHMEVVDAHGGHVGTVDYVQGDQIKLTRADSSDGRHHYLPLDQVAGIENGKVRLS